MADDCNFQTDEEKLASAGNNKETEIKNNKESNSKPESEIEKQNGHSQPNPNDSLRNGNSVDPETEESNDRNTGEAVLDDNLELDLADPESVIHMLETVDLTEEDTEGLLQEAYNMNRKLKEMLRRQEETGSSGSKAKTKSKGNAAHRNGKSDSTNDHSTVSSKSGSRSGSSFGARKVLPPIPGENPRETSVYAIKLKRSHTHMADMRHCVSDQAVPRTRSTKPDKHPKSPTRKQKSSGARPEWNDRFNYS